MQTPKKFAFTSPSKSPRVNTGENGVEFFNHMVRDIMLPYGESKDFDLAAYFRNLKPEKCEWLRRPLVAFSEMGSTLKKNVDVQSKANSIFLRIANAIPENIDQAVASDEEIDVVFAMVRSLSKEDVDNLNHTFKEGNAMVNFSFHILQLKALLENPSMSAALIEPTVALKMEPANAVKAGPSVSNMKSFIKTVKTCPRGWSSVDNQEKTRLQQEVNEGQKKIDFLMANLKNPKRKLLMDSSSSESESD